MKKIGSVLLIDDDSIANFLNQDIINSLGITENLFIRENGLEAINYFNTLCENDSCPELIFLDLNMPIMDGFEFLEAFRNLEYPEKNKVKIVVLTTSNNPRDLERAKNLGCNDYLTKPLSADKIRDVLNRNFLVQELERREA